MVYETLYHKEEKEDDHIPKGRRCRNQRSMLMQTPYDSTDKRSFFSHIIRDWNDLPVSLIASVEVVELFSCISQGD